jgi:hypothetical protein
MKQKNNPQNEILIYTTPTEKVKIEVLFRDETIWLTQKKMAELFDVAIPTINEHLSNIFKRKELNKNSVIRKFLITASDNKKYQTNFYNLDAIISVGYRVNSEKATQFRIWATQTLKDFIIKGFVLDDERLKNGENFGKDYFQELLERVRSIRASERRIYLKITDIFSECTIDYDPKSSTTKDFFAMVQNKFHFAITGKTASEIVHTKADHKKKNMGLTTWKNSPKGRILSSDVTIAKNYLLEKQIKRLERTVSSFFDYIENIIENKQLIKMKDFAKSVDKFLAFNEFKILDNKGKISQKQAKNKALKEYKIFNKHQKIESDFEKQVIKKLKQIKK